MPTIAPWGRTRSLVQVGVGDPGLVEIRIWPSVSTAAQKEAVGQEMPANWLLGAMFVLCQVGETEEASLDTSTSPLCP